MAANIVRDLSEQKMLERAEMPKIPAGAVASLAAFVLISASLLNASSRLDFQNLHTALDTGMCLLSGVLALLLWDMGARLDRPFKKWLAVAFAATFLLEFIHIAVTIEWFGSLAPISNGILRPSTWPPAALTLPLALCGALWMLHREVRSVAWFALATAVAAAAVFILYQSIPPYSPAGLLGVTRPALVPVSILWGTIAWACWKLRERDRALPTLGLLAATFLLASLAMLYSRAPSDAFAMVAHLGRVTGYLALLIALMHMASLDMVERIRAEAQLARLNEHLDARVLEQTALLRTTNDQLTDEIAKRRKSHEALAESEERARAIIETSLDAVIGMDREGRIVDWSAQAVATFGWMREEALGRRLGELIVPERHRARHTNGLARYLATNEARILNRRIEISGLHRDGREFPIELSITAIRSAGAIAFSGFIRDITERKEAEAKVHAQLERMSLLDHITRAIGERQDLGSIFQVAVRSIEDQLPADFVCLALYDRSKKVLVVARVGAKSAPLAATLAMTEQGLVEVDENGLSRCMAGKLVYEPDISASHFPFPQRLAGGGLRSFVAAPLQVESNVLGALIVARTASNGFVSGECEFLRQLSEHVALAATQAQLTEALQQAYDELRRTQDAVMQQERLRALGQMASGIAHDINNALSPISLYTESILTMDKDLSAASRDKLEIVQRAIDDAAHTVGRMKNFYRQSETELDLAPVSFAPLVQQVLDLTQSRWKDMAQERGVDIEIRVALADDLPPILGVESELREVLINLVFNAVDALPTGGVITIGGRHLERGDLVQIEICDNGIGMDEPTRQRCLEPFFTTKGEAGSGLGLAMVYGTLQRHGGDLEITSAPGQGTTMCMTFAAAHDPATKAKTEIAAGPIARMRLLLIDDDPILLRTLRDVLSAEGHAIVVASEGAAGVTAFKAALQEGKAFEAVITDLGMPKMDGRRVAAAIKEMAPKTPVLLLTGWGERLMAEQDVPAHVDVVLSKPPKLRDLRAALARAALDEASARRA